MPRVTLVFEPPDGGVAEHVRLLAAALVDRGWGVEVVCAPEAIVRPALQAGGIPIHPVPFAHGLRRPGADLRAARALRRVLRRIRTDVLHCHSFKAGVAGRMLGPGLGLPVVYTPHGLIFKAGSRPVRRALLTAERALAARTSALVCVSEDERRLAQAAGLGKAGLVLIRNGTRPCEPGEVDAGLAAVRAAGPLAACVTVLREEKGVQTFIDAVPRVLTAVPEARLAVVGEGPHAPVLRARAAHLAGEPRFAFLDFEPPAERYLRATDVFVLASDREGLPLSALEAMACGVPVVATRVGGTPEAVTPDTGILVAPRDPGALAAAIVTLLRDPARRATMGALARRRHAELFTVDTMANGVVAAYEQVLDRRPPARSTG